MLLTVENYKKTLPREAFISAKKYVVRECDETEKGCYVAYVDGDNKSFDVSLKISAEGNIERSACDCGSNTSFCDHSLALLMHVADGGKKKSPLKSNKKNDKTGMLLDAADTAELKNWVRQLLQKNKDIEISFVHHFGDKTQQFNVEDIKTTINNSIKAVTGNKKNIDAAQSKKLVDLWGATLEPVIQYYYQNVMVEQAFLNFHTLATSSISYENRVATNSARITRFRETLLSDAIAHINGLQIDEAWVTAIGYYVQHLTEAPNNKLNMPYLGLLQHIASECDKPRLHRLIELMATHYGKLDKENMTNSEEYMRIMFSMIDGSGLFNKYYNIFEMIIDDDFFNFKILYSLVEINMPATAAKHCQEQIDRNYYIYKSHNQSIKYLEIQKKIFTDTKDNENLLSVLLALLPYNFNFNECMHIYNLMPKNERPEIVKKVLKITRDGAIRGNENAIILLFNLLDHEKNYKTMIDYIDTRTTYALIHQYFEPMLAADKQKLLKTILQKTDPYYTPTPALLRKEEDIYFPNIFSLTKKAFTIKQINTAIQTIDKSKSYYHENRLVNYFMKHL